MTVQILGTDKTIRINNYPVLGLVQNLNWAPNFNAQDVQELGRTTRLDTLMELETSGSFEVVSSGNLAGIIARMKVAFSGANFNGFEYATTGPVSGVVTGVNDYQYTQDDLANLKFDLIEHQKTDQSTFNRSTYLACCYPTTFTGRVDANGMAMDTVNFAGQYVVGFPSPYHDVVAVPAIRTGTNTMTISGTAGVSATTHTLAYVTVDSRPIRSINTDPVYATLSTTTITLTGATVPVGGVCMALLFRTTPSATWATTHAPHTVGSETNGTAVYGVRGFQANVYIAPDGTVDGDGMLTPNAASQWLRVQSVDYTIDLRMETLRQIALNIQGTSVYHRAPTFPLSMSVNASVTETDWADWKAIMTKSFTGATPADWVNNAYEFTPQYLKKEFAVVLQYFTKDGTKIQQLEFNDMRPDGMGSRVNVGGRGEISWTFRGTAMTLKGYDLA
jgi:hypothetical protein